MTIHKQRAAFAGGLAITATLIAGGAAHAAFPGKPGRIFYVSNASGHFNIYSMNSDGFGVRRITRAARDEYQVDVSPNGRTLLFAGDTPAGWRIFSLPASGRGRARQLTTASGMQTRPRWSPSGKQILYSSTQNGPLHVYVMNADGTGQHDLTPGPAYSGYPVWAPDGHHIAFTSDRSARPTFRQTAVYTARADGSQVRRITPLRLNAGDEDVSPDGHSLVFSDNYCATCAAGDLYRIRLNGRGLVRLTRSPHRNDIGARFSPDGQRITYITSRYHPKTGTTGPQDIMTMRTDGTLMLNLTQTPRINESDPLWARRR